jgi:hypothetical protein
MDKYLRTTLMVLAILVLAALLFNLGIQLYWMLSGAPWVGHGALLGPMMGGRVGIHHLAGFGFGFGFLGPILGIGLVVLLVVGIVALARGGRGQAAGPNAPAEPKP